MNSNQQNQLSFIDNKAFSSNENGSRRAEPNHVETLPFIDSDQFPGFEEIDHGSLFSLSLSNDTSDLTHGLHRFPAKFIPQVPRWALGEFTHEGSIVVDPFMGSGTTLVEALLHPVTAIGLDIDPLARLIGRAKSEVCGASRISHLGRKLHKNWNGPVLTPQPPMPDIKNFGHWFTTDAWSKLQALVQNIKSLECSKHEQRFLLAIYSSILRRVSNADNQSHKTYVSGTNPKTPPEVIETFWSSFNRAVTGLKRLELVRHEASKADVPDSGDALDFGLPSETVDLIVTSPPYMDSVDYMYNFMMEYFWLGPHLGVPDRATFNQMRRQTVGAKNPYSKETTVPDTLKEIVESTHLHSKRLDAAASYLSKMDVHFREAARCLKDGGRYVLVVGNSQTKKGILPIHDCLVRLAWDNGLELEKAFAYRIRRHYMKFPRKGRGGIILIDWIIVLKKTGGHSPPPEPLPLFWATLRDGDVAH